MVSILGKFANHCFVNPWGVEPQSKEPESFILSIELRVHHNNWFFQLNITVLVLYDRIFLSICF